MADKEPTAGEVVDRAVDTVGDMAGSVARVARRAAKGIKDVGGLIFEPDEAVRRRGDGSYVYSVTQGPKGGVKVTKAKVVHD